ncbi:MAG TPA: phenylalanine--tRNA ligase subunit beta [Candidatus Paceibacterota bacterium]
MLFSYNWLKEYSKEKLPAPEKLADLLSLHAFEVESVSKEGSDSVLAIDVLPNRAHDCLNHIGMAREISAIMGKKTTLPKTKPAKAAKGSLPQLKVKVESGALVPRYAGLVVEGVTIDKSPKKAREYLAAVGVNSINNIVDLTNFIMLELGQPLHAFDYNQIQGNSMYVRRAKAGEKLETLDDQTLTLPEGALVIEDANRLIDLAGMKGGKVSGISPNTKNIFLQAAHFNATTIYKTKKILKYTTQAADIYAHGIDPNLGMQALERANQLLQEWGIGGKVVQVVDIYPAKGKPKLILLDLDFVRSMLGVAIPKPKAKKTLQDLGCTVADKGNLLRVEVPTRRLDLEIPEDLVEEIGRIYGYENIPSAFPAASLAPPRKNSELFWQEFTRDRMKELGFTEVYNYSFIGQKDVRQFAYSPDEQKNLIELENPVSEDVAFMRDSLLENLLKNIHSNVRKQGEIRIFELGKVFSKKNKKFEETKMLGAVVLGGNFYAIKGVIDFLLESMGISGVWYDSYKATPEKSRAVVWHTGKSAEIKVNNQEIGFVGEISSRVTQGLKITQSVVAFHINMDMLAQLASEEKEYLLAPKYPSIVRDVAILAPGQTKVIDVMNAIHDAGGTMVRDIDVFDVFEGGNLPGGKKNLAFHIVYQSDEKTLTNKEVDAIHERIIKAIEENPLWQARK